MKEEKSVKPEKKTIVSGYFHISNSGATIAICDAGHGPQLEIHSSAFGNIDSTFKLLLTKDSLEQLVKMLDKASKCNFSKDYVCAAQLYNVEYSGEEIVNLVKQEILGNNDSQEKDDVHSRDSEGK